MTNEHLRFAIRKGLDHSLPNPEIQDALAELGLLTQMNVPISYWQRVLDYPDLYHHLTKTIEPPHFDDPVVVDLDQFDQT